MCVSLALALKEMTRFIKGFGSGYCVIIIIIITFKELCFFFFFKPLELGWINVYRRNIFMVAEAVAFHFFWCYSHPLRLQWDLGNFYPEHFLKTPPTPSNLQCLLVCWVSV